MRDQERIIKVKELLDTFDNSQKVASKIVNSYFRSNKFIGSKDRKFISKSFWNILRNRYKIKWHLQNLNLKNINSYQVILELFFLNEDYKNNIIKIKNLLILASQTNQDFSSISLDFLDSELFKNFNHPNMPDYVHYELQEFLLNSIQVSFPDQWLKIVLSINKEAFFDIRVNRIKKMSRDQLSMKLRSLEIDHEYSHYSPLGIRLKKRYPIEIKNFINDQKKNSSIPKKEEILIENFPFNNGQYLCIFTFMGKQTNQTLSEILINFLKEKNNILISDYTINEYSLALFLNKNANFKINLLDNFFSKKKKIDFLKTSIAKKIFKEISLITGLIDKKILRKQNFVNSDIIFDTLFKYQSDHILLKIAEEEIKKYFTEITQIDYLFKKKVTFNKIQKPSPFSETLIFQKEKNRIDVHNPDNLFEFLNN